MQNPENKASLGCGTLILIALIVMIFGNSNRSDDKQITDKILQLQSEIGSLRFEVGKQSDSLVRIEKSLNELNSRAKHSRPRVIVPHTPEAPLPEN